MNRREATAAARWLLLRRGLLAAVLLTLVAEPIRADGSWSAVGAKREPEQQEPPQEALQSELEQLKAEREAVLLIRESAEQPIGAPESTAEQREALRQQVMELMSEVARRPRPDAKPAARSKPAGTGESAVSAKPSLLPVAKRPKESVGSPNPVDAMALGQVLFRTGSFEDALKAFRLVERSNSDPRVRVVVRYFIAICLGKTGKKQESSVLFRELANSKDDEFIAECARWQLAAQQWRDDVAVRIQQLQSAAEGLGSSSGSGDAAAVEGAGAESGAAVVSEGN